MQKQAIVMVLGAACLGAFGVSHAGLTPLVSADLDAVNASGRIVYIAGADVLQTTFSELAGALFTGPVTRFSDTSVQGANRNYEAALGVASAGAKTWAGQKVLLIYRVKGGATAGILPVATASSIESLYVTSALCGSQGSGSATTPYSCPPTSAGSGRVADAVLTDAHLSLSSFYMNLAGEGSIDPISENDLATFAFSGSQPLFSLMEGIAVTNTVGQGAKLNRAALSAIMSANVVNWHEVSKAEPAEDMVVCLNTPGSGTRTASNTYFNRVGCYSDSTSTPDRYSNDVNADGTPKWDEANKKYTIKRGSGTPTYIENGSTADVRACLNAAVNGGTYSTTDRSGAPSVTVSFVGSGHRAIGILPLDNLVYSTPTGPWQFRSLDGAGQMTMSAGAVSVTGSGKFPTQENHLDGTWDFSTIPFLNIPQRTVGGKLDILNFIVETVGNPAQMASFSDLSSRLSMAAIPSRVRSPNFPVLSGPIGSATNNVLSVEFMNDHQCSIYQKNY